MLPMILIAGRVRSKSGRRYSFHEVNTTIYKFFHFLNISLSVLVTTFKKNEPTHEILGTLFQLLISKFSEVE